MGNRVRVIAGSGTKEWKMSGGARQTTRGLSQSPAMTVPPPDSTPGPTPVASAPVEREKLSILLKRLAHEFSERPLGFEELVHLTQGRAYDVLLIFLSLPFLTPVPLPFLSTALGSVMVLIGARLALGQRPWLPQRLLQRKIEGRNLGRLLNAGSKILRWLEIFLRPRLAFVHTTWIFQRLTGVLIVFSGALLLLPLPIPFSNILPAATVLLLAAGALERDGVFFFAGCLLFAVNLVFFGALAIGGIEAVSWVLQWSGWGDAE
jgi:hypothetical protein